MGATSGVGNGCAASGFCPRLAVASIPSWSFTCHKSTQISPLCVCAAYCRMWSQLHLVPFMVYGRVVKTRAGRRYCCVVAVQYNEDDSIYYSMFQRCGCLPTFSVEKAGSGALIRYTNFVSLYIYVYFTDTDGEEIETKLLCQ